MSKNCRIFTSFAVEDKHLRNFLVRQARDERSPFEFVDMSVKEPWESAWKTKCRTKIRGCDGVIGIITKNTSQADGQLWELKCAYDENIPVCLIFGSSSERPTRVPALIGNRRIYNWTWDNLERFLERV